MGVNHLQLIVDAGREYPNLASEECEVGLLT